MIRKILSVIAGLAVAILIFLVAETINSSLHPIPSTLDVKDEVAVKAFYENQPLSLWILVLTGWFTGSFLCGLIIQLISRDPRKILPVIAGSILTVSAIINFFSIPHPVWFIVVGLLLFIPAVLLGHQSCKK